MTTPAGHPSPASSVPPPSPDWSMVRERLFPPLGDKRLAHYYRQLATLLDAGVPIIRALDTAARGAGGDAAAAAILQRISRMVAAGQTIAEGMATAPHVFRPLHREMVHTGEETGHLPGILKDLAGWCDDRVAARKQLIEGMIRPVLLLHAVVLIPLVPRLVLGQISLAGYLFKAGLVLGPFYLSGLAALAAWRLGVTRPATRQMIYETIHRVPVVGTAVWKLGVARLCRALRLLYLAGVELPSAVRTAGRASGDPALAAACVRASKALARGETLTAAFAATGRFSSRVLTMIETGEIAGRLHFSLEKLDEYFAEEARTTLRRSIRLFSFAIYFGMMLLVAYYIISFYAAYFSQIGDASKL